MGSEKAKAAVKYGADTIMDLSTGPDYQNVLNAIMGSVDVQLEQFQFMKLVSQHQNNKVQSVNMDEDDMFNAIENQAKAGVDLSLFICGITKDLIAKVQDSNRIMGIVSRRWIIF